jgi:hypothetical protein
MDLKMTEYVASALRKLLLQCKREKGNGVTHPLRDVKPCKRQAVLHVNFQVKGALIE